MFESMTAVRTNTVAAVTTASRLLRGAVVGAVRGAVDGVRHELHPAPTPPALPAASDEEPGQTPPAAGTEEPTPNFVVDPAAGTTPTEDRTAGDGAGQNATGDRSGTEPPLRPVAPIDARRRRPAAARSATGGRSTTARPRTGSVAGTARHSAATSSRTGVNAGVLPVTDSMIRTWARQHGHQVSDRGRVPQRIRQAYLNAH